MFDLGWSEILVIAVVAILVVGPKDLPRLMRTVGEWVARARRMAAHFQSGVDEMIRQSELEDLRNDLKAMHRDMNTPVATTTPRISTTPPPDKMVELDPPQTIAPPAPLPLPATTGVTIPEPPAPPPSEKAST
jgi:sec-independent protein translocase protein TatB